MYQHIKPMYFHIIVTVVMFVSIAGALALENAEKIRIGNPLKQSPDFPASRRALTFQRIRRTIRLIYFFPSDFNATAPSQIHRTHNCYGK